MTGKHSSGATPSADPHSPEYRAQELVQLLEAKVARHQKQAQEEEHWELERMISHLHTLSIYKLNYAVLHV
jgi:hypothetical protein